MLPYCYLSSARLTCVNLLSDADHIPSYPRDIPTLARRQDTTRKDARKRKKERKQAELEKRKEEVRRLRALKMRELKHKLEKVGREGGLEVDGKLFPPSNAAEWVFDLLTALQSSRNLTSTATGILRLMIDK